MSAKKSKARERKQWIIVAAIVAAVALLAAWWCILKVSQSSKEYEQSTVALSDAAKFKQHYSQVADDNRFVYVSPSEIKQIFEHGSGLVFLGFKECPWCQKLALTIDEAAKVEGLTKVYYMDIRQARANNDVTYQMLVKKLKDYLAKDGDGNPRIFVPDVTALHDGKIVGRFLPETSIDDKGLTPGEYWTTERRADAIKQLREIIAKTR